MIHVLAIEFPPISHVIEWPSGPLGINKVVVLMWVSVALVFGIMYAGSRKKALVPKGVQNVAETAVDFVHNGIVLETIGPDGMKFAPFLFTLFTFIFALNIWGIVPGAQMPVNARIALPMFMALLVWVIYLVVGIAKQGPIGYFKNAMFPPGVPIFLYVLVSPIELVQILIVRPLSPGGPTLRQHARRPPSSHELRSHHGVALEPVAADRHLAVLARPADRSHRLSRCWCASCRRSSSRSSPRCTSVARCTPTTDTEKRSTDLT